MYMYIYIYILTDSLHLCVRVFVCQSLRRYHRATAEEAVVCPLWWDGPESCTGGPVTNTSHDQCVVLHPVKHPKEPGIWRLLSRMCGCRLSRKSSWKSSLASTPRRGRTGWGTSGSTHDVLQQWLKNMQHDLCNVCEIFEMAPRWLLMYKMNTGVRYLAPDCVFLGSAVIGAFPDSFGGVTRSQLTKWNFLLLSTSRTSDLWICLMPILLFGSCQALFTLRKK